MEKTQHNRIATKQWFCRRRQKGMTMLEVVVSMLVIGLGLAMSISMIQTANRFGNSAEFSHSALEQAQAIIDKMRANSAAAPTYGYIGTAVITPTTDSNYDAMYNAVANQSTYDTGISDLVVECFTGISADDCASVGAIAKADMKAWSESLRELLPGGRGLINIRNVNNTNIFDVIVMWRNSAETDSDQNSSAQGIRVSFTL